MRYCTVRCGEENERKKHSLNESENDDKNAPAPQLLHAGNGRRRRLGHFDVDGYRQHVGALCGEMAGNGARQYTQSEAQTKYNERQAWRFFCVAFGARTSPRSFTPCLTFLPTMPLSLRCFMVIVWRTVRGVNGAVMAPDHRAEGDSACDKPQTGPSAPFRATTAICSGSAAPSSVQTGCLAPFSAPGGTAASGRPLCRQARNQREHRDAQSTTQCRR